VHVFFCIKKLFFLSWRIFLGVKNAISMSDFKAPGGGRKASSFKKRYFFPFFVTYFHIFADLDPDNLTELNPVTQR
jgi:hypothetical protein